jgi:hypothetical protein
MKSFDGLLEKHFIIGSCWPSPLKQDRHAIAHERVIGRQGMLGCPESSENGIGRDGDILQGIEQGSVEVKDDCRESQGFNPFVAERRRRAARNCLNRGLTTDG